MTDLERKQRDALNRVAALARDLEARVDLLERTTESQRVRIRTLELQTAALAFAV